MGNLGGGREGRGKRRGGRIFRRAEEAGGATTPLGPERQDGTIVELLI